VCNSIVLARLVELYRDIILHDGFGEIRLEVRILRKGQKEVIIHCGKQYRYVVDFDPGRTPEELERFFSMVSESLTSGPADGGSANGRQQQ